MSTSDASTMTRSDEPITDEEAAGLVLASGFAWVHQRDRAFCVRVSKLAGHGAERLKSRFGGSAYEWKATGEWS